LFSGAGGLDLGFHNTGLVDTLCCYEINEIFSETLRINRAKLTSDVESKNEPVIIQHDLLDSTVIDNAIKRWSDVDIVYGGPPCQSFSIMGRTVEGKKTGIDDPRGALIYSFLEIIDGIRPKAFLFENVPNITNIENGRIVDEFRSKFKDMGYSIWSGILCAADFGAYTFRKRFFIIGIQGDIELGPPQPTNAFQGQHDIFHGSKEPWLGCGTLFSQLEEAERNGSVILNHEKINHNPETIARFSKLKFGETDNVRKRNRLDPMRPAHSIYVGGKTGKLQARTHIHPTEPRELTARECALIQGFPIDWEFAGRTDAAVLQAANAVPVQLAAALGNYVIDGLVSIEGMVSAERQCP
jgi:DNA (cytosine-5)-methyltransferase 1